MMRGRGSKFQGAKRKISEKAAEEKFVMEPYVPPSILPSENPDIDAPDTWTKEMKQFYLDPKPENRTNTVSGILSKMPSNSNWAVSSVDYHRSIGSRDRYYGIRCHNCNQCGHIQSNCPDKKRIEVCINCGVQGHTENRCTELLCVGCGRLTDRMCSSCYYCRKERDIFCKICSYKGHSENRCSDHWRKYRFTTKPGPVQIPSDGSEKKKRRSLLWCPNCAQKGHLFENCTYMNVEDPSALSSFVSLFDSMSTSSQNSLNKNSGSKVRKLNTQNVTPSKPRSKSSSPELIIDFESIKNSHNEVEEVKLIKQNVSPTKSKSSSPEIINEKPSTSNSKNSNLIINIENESTIKSKSPEILVEEIRVALQKSDNVGVCLCIPSELSSKKISLISQLTQALKLVHNASGNIADAYSKIIENKHLLAHDISLLNRHHPWLLRLVQNLTIFLVGKFGLNGGDFHVSELQELLSKVKKVKTQNVSDEMLEYIRHQYRPVFSGDYKFKAIRDMVNTYTQQCPKSDHVAKIIRMLKRVKGSKTE